MNEEKNLIIDKIRKGVFINMATVIICTAVIIFVIKNKS